MHANQILDPIFHQVLDPCLNTPEQAAVISVLAVGYSMPGGGTLNVEVIGMLVGNFLGNPKKYSDFDFKPLKNT